MDNKTTKLISSEPPRHFYGYTIVIASTIILMCIIGLYLSMGVFFKPMLSEFGWTRATTSISWAISNIISGIFYILSSWLNDRFGPRVLAMLCAFSAGLGYVLMSQIQSVWGLYFFYGVLVGASISIFPPLLSTVARWFVRRRTFMTGIMVGGGGLGGFVGPIISNWLISTYDWRKAYIILGISIFIVVNVAAQFLKYNPATVHQKPYGFDEIKNLTREKALEGLSRKSALRTRQFWLIILAFFCFGWCVNVITLHIAPHVSDIGNPAGTAASVLAAISGVSIIGRTGFASIGDKIGNKNCFVITYFLMAITLFWLVSIKELWMFYAFATIFGLAYGSGFTQGSPLTANIFGLKLHSFVIGIMYFGQMVGAAIGTFLSGYIFDISGSYQWAFVICGVLSALALTATTILKPIKNAASDKLCDKLR
jgi:OFA family oxalate/formate antiporter-like MFS transporter